MLSEPAAGAQDQLLAYRGWVPTISGRLSFSVFGEAQEPTESVFANTADDSTRYLAVYQFRDTSDTLVPARGKLGPFMLGLDGQFYFTFLARTSGNLSDKQSFLVGRAFIFRKNPAWKGQILPALNNYQDKLRRFSYSANCDLDAYAATTHQHMLDFCSTHCAFFAEVSVSRTGTADLYLPKPFNLPEDAPKLPADPLNFSGVAHLLCSQIFYFVKDIGHRHQHHDSSTDQIIPLYEYDGEDERAWRERTLYSIYRKVIEIKRHPHLTTFSDSLGLIAYAESFSLISEEELLSRALKEGKDRETRPKFPVYHARQIADSIISTRSRVEREFANRQRRCAQLRNTVFSVAGVLLSITGLLALTGFKTKAVPHPHLTSLFGLIVESPYISLALLVVGLWVIFHLSNEGARLPRPLTHLMRFLQPLRRGLLIMLITAFAVAFAIVFAVLLAGSLRIPPPPTSIITEAPCVLAV